MNATIYSRAMRGALALGMVGGAWLVLSAWTPVGLSPSADAASAPAGSGYILLAQADAAQEAPAEGVVSYTSEQARRGQTEYTWSCVECHGDDLRGGILGGPPLRGLNFESKFADGMPAGVLFEFMSATMPPDAPGRFSADIYADLMAYILEQNGFAEGDPLPSDVDALYELIMEK